jgi:hypothetical protein
MDLKALWERHGKKVLMAIGGLIATAVVTAVAHYLLQEFSIKRIVQVGGPVWSMQGPIEETKAVGQQYCSGGWSFVPRIVAWKNCQEVRLGGGIERLNICPPGGASPAQLSFSDALIGLHQIQELAPDDSKCLQVEYEGPMTVSVSPGQNAKRVVLYSLDTPAQGTEEFYCGCSTSAIEAYAALRHMSTVAPNERVPQRK